MEYILGPVLALLISAKFADVRIKRAHERIAIELKDMQLESLVEMEAKLDKSKNDMSAAVNAKVIENNKTISQQTLKMMMPMTVKIQEINKQLGL